MLKLSVALLALISGVIAEEFCFEPVHKVCPHDNRPKAFPGTAEELEEFCTFATGFLECGVKYSKACDDSRTLNEASKYLGVFQDICNQDTLLYATVVENLQCFKEILMGAAAEECHRVRISPSDEIFQKYAEVMGEEGVDLSDDEDNALNTLGCVNILQEMACYASQLEAKCGIVAVDAYLELVPKFAPVALCGEKYHYLPKVIDVYKIIQEEANEVEEVFRKKK